MPVGADARRRAALLEIELVLGGVRCALGLLGDGSDPRLQRSVVEIVVEELGRAERALTRIH